MARKTRKSITTDKKGHSSNINIKKGGKVTKKQSTNAVKNVTITNSNCQKCSKRLTNFNKRKSGVCVACLKNESIVSTKSKNIDLSKSSLKPTKQMVNSSKKNNVNLSRTKNSPKSKSQRNITNTSSSKGTESSKSTVKSDAKYFKEQQNSKRSSDKSKLSQTSKTVTMGLRSNKRSYTELSRGESNEKVTKKRKCSITAEQLTNRASRNKKPTVKGSEWKSTIGSKRVSYQSEETKKGTSPLKNKSPKSNQLKNNTRGNKTIIKPANTKRTNKIDSVIVTHVPRKPVKRLLRNKEVVEQTHLNSKRPKTVTKKITPSKNKSGKQKNIVSSNKKTIARVTKTNEIKNLNVSNSGSRRSNARSKKTYSTSEDNLADNFLIAKDILNGLLNSIPSVGVDDAIIESGNISRYASTDLDSVKSLEEKNVDSTNQLRNLESHRNKENIDIHVDSETKNDNLKCSVNSELYDKELSDQNNLCVANSAISLTTAELMMKDSIKQNYNEHIECISKQNEDSELLQESVDKSNKQKNKETTSTLVESTISDDKTTLEENMFYKVSGISSCNKNSTVEPHSTITENNGIARDNETIVCTEHLKNSVAENKLTTDFDNNKTKVNLENIHATKHNFETLSEHTNLQSTRCVKENIADTTSLSPNKSEENERTLSCKTLASRDLKESTNNQLLTDSRNEDKDGEKQLTNEELLVFDKNIECQDINDENQCANNIEPESTPNQKEDRETSSLSNIQSRGSDTEKMSDNVIEIKNVSSHKDRKVCNDTLITNNEHDTATKNLDLLRNEVIHNSLQTISNTTDVSIRKCVNVVDASKADECANKLSLGNTTTDNIFDVSPKEVEYNKITTKSNNSVDISYKCEQTDRDTSRKEISSYNVIGSDNNTTLPINTELSKGNVCYEVEKKCENLLQIETVELSNTGSAQKHSSSIIPFYDSKSIKNFDQNIVLEKVSTNEVGDVSILSSDKVPDRSKNIFTEEVKCNKKISGDSINIDSKCNQSDIRDPMRKETIFLKTVVTDNVIEDGSKTKDVSVIKAINKFDQNISSEKLSINENQIAIKLSIGNKTDNDLKKESNSCDLLVTDNAAVDHSDNSKTIKNVVDQSIGLENLLKTEYGNTNEFTRNINDEETSVAMKTNKSFFELPKLTNIIVKSGENSKINNSSCGIIEPVRFESDIKMTDSISDKSNNIKGVSCKDSIIDSVDHNALSPLNIKDNGSIHNEMEKLKDSPSSMLENDEKLLLTGSALNNSESEDILPTIGKYSQNNLKEYSVNGTNIIAADVINTINSKNNGLSLEIAYNAISDNRSANDDVKSLSICNKITHEDNKTSDPLHIGFGSSDIGLISNNETVERLESCKTNIDVTDPVAKKVLDDDIVSTVNKTTLTTYDENPVLPKMIVSKADITTLPNDTELSQENVCKNLLQIETVELTNTGSSENNDTTKPRLLFKEVDKNIKEVSPEKKVSNDSSMSAIAKVNTSIDITEIESVNISIKVETKSTEHVISIEHDTNHEVHIKTENIHSMGNAPPKIKLDEDHSQKETCSQNNSSELKRGDERIHVKSAIVSAGDFGGNDGRQFKNTMPENVISNAHDTSSVHSGTALQLPNTEEGINGCDEESMQCNSETQSSNRMSVDEDNTEMDLDTDSISDVNPSTEINVDFEMNMDVN